MIIAEIEEELRRRRTKTLMDHAKDPKFVVYVDSFTLDKIRKEFADLLYSPSMDMSMPLACCGWPLYVVQGKDHSWKVYEVTE